MLFPWEPLQYPNSDSEEHHDTSLGGFFGVGGVAAPYNVCVGKIWTKYDCSLLVIGPTVPC